MIYILPQVPYLQDIIPQSSENNFCITVLEKNSQGETSTRTPVRNCFGTSLVSQWIRIHLPMQATWHGLDPWCRKTSHAAGQLSPCTSTTEACVPGAHVLQREKPLQREAGAPQQKTIPRLSQLEKACAKQQRPSTAKNKWINKNFKKRKKLFIATGSVNERKSRNNLNVSYRGNG